MQLPGWSELRSRTRQALTSASYLALLAVGLHVGQTTVWVVCLGLVSAIGFVAWALTYRRARAIADLATSRIGSAAQGYVELVGRASVAADELIHSPVSGAVCIWYRYRLYTRDSGRSGWREVDSGTSTATFEIADGSGACRVDPEHAEVVSPERRVSYAAGEKRVEELLFGGSLIYVLGDLTTLSGTHHHSSVSEDVGAVLTDWKRDPARLRKRFDLDANGEIDPREWEVARRLARATVERQRLQTPPVAEVHIVRAPADGRLFLISALPPQKLRRRFLWWSWFHLGVALLGVVGLVSLRG